MSSAVYVPSENATELEMNGKTSDHTKSTPQDKTPNNLNSSL